MVGDPKRISGMIGGGPLTVVLASDGINVAQQIETLLPQALNMNVDTSNKGEAPFTRGQITLVGNVRARANSTVIPSHLCLTMQVELLGVIGSTTERIGSFVFGNPRNNGGGGVAGYTTRFSLANYSIEDPWDSFQFMTSQVLDGVPDVSFAPAVFTFNAIGRFYR